MANCSVIWLNKPANLPNSSFSLAAICRLKSPCATAFAPSANAKIGSTNRRAKLSAAVKAIKIAKPVATPNVIKKNCCKPLLANINSAYLARAASIN